MISLFIHKRVILAGKRVSSARDGKPKPIPGTWIAHRLPAVRASPCAMHIQIRSWRISPAQIRLERICIYPQGYGQESPE
ncbi:MAG: hypothetical protein PHY16_02930 [Methylobacter sp.]|nr:hypothetical protein [Methylobacter sp.]